MSKCASCVNAARDLLLSLAVPVADPGVWRRVFNALHRRHTAGFTEGRQAEWDAHFGPVELQP